MRARGAPAGPAPEPGSIVDVDRSSQGPPRDGAALTVFLVDDHEMVRRGVAALLTEDDGLTVIGQAGTAAQALALIPVVRPDVVILDVRLPDGNGVQLCRELRSRLPELRCLMLTSYTDEQAMTGAFLAGADGYVIKDITGTDLVLAVRVVGAGRCLLDHRAAAAVLARLHAGTAPPGPLAGLNDQQHTVLTLIGEGLTNREISERMHVAERTVKNYVSHLLAKLGMTGRTQIAVLAAETRGRQQRPV